MLLRCVHLQRLGFYYRAMFIVQSAVIATRMLCVCPSVCLSVCLPVTLRYVCGHTNWSTYRPN